MQESDNFAQSWHGKILEEKGSVILSLIFLKFYPMQSDLLCEQTDELWPNAEEWRWNLLSRDNEKNETIKRTRQWKEQRMKIMRQWKEYDNEKSSKSSTFAFKETASRSDCLLC